MPTWRRWRGRRRRSWWPCTRRSSSAAMLKLKAAARVAETDQWRQEGAADPESWLGQKTGTSKRSAKRSLDAAKRLGDQPATKAAAEQGQLSEDQLQEVSEGVEANPAAEAGLLESARNEPFAGLKQKATAAKASAGDRRTRQERIRRQRSCRTGTDEEGAFWGELCEIVGLGQITAEAAR